MNLHGRPHSTVESPPPTDPYLVAVLMALLFLLALLL